MLYWNWMGKLESEGSTGMGEPWVGEAKEARTKGTCNITSRIDDWNEYVM